MSDRKALFATLMAKLGMGEFPQSLIGGQLLDGRGADITLEDPYTRQTLAHYADCDAELACSACEHAFHAQKIWSQQYSAAARGNVMQAIASAVDASLEPVAQLEALVAGKPIRDCRVEVSKVVVWSSNPVNSHPSPASLWFY